jgi:hypothetical protein
MKSNPVILEAACVLAWALMIVGNVLSVLGLVGPSNSTIAHEFPTLVMPGDYAFSIWSFIFAATGVEAIYNLVLAVKKQSQPYRLWFAPLFIVNMLCNGVWSIVFAQKAFWVCLFLMFVILGTLFAMLILLYRYDNDTNSMIQSLLHVRSTGCGSFCSFSFARAANWMWIGCYSGWMTVATLLNFAIVLKYEIHAFGPIHGNSTAIPPAVLHGELGYTVTAICTAVVAAVAIALCFADWGYAATVAWAVYAISVRSGDFASLPQSGR